MNDRLQEHRRQSGRPINDVTASGLGWLSIGLGAAEVLMPRLMGRVTGMRGASALLFLYGVREIVTGIGLLKARDPTPWLWARVAGDALDLTTLAGYRRSHNKVRNSLAMAAVAGVAAVDLTMAKAMSERAERRSRTWQDYGDRSGFAGSTQEMRGIARRDFELPRDMRAAAPVEEELAL